MKTILIVICCVLVGILQAGDVKPSLSPEVQRLLNEAEARKLAKASSALTDQTDAGVFKAVELQRRSAEIDEEERIISNATSAMSRMPKGEDKEAVRELLKFSIKNTREKLDILGKETVKSKDELLEVRRKGLLQMIEAVKNDPGFKAMK